MRLTVCLESDTEGRVLASVDMEEILKQCKENSISKEAFEQMKSKSYRHGYRQGYSKAIDDFATLMKESLNQDWATTKAYGPITYNRLFNKFNEIAEQLKKKYNE